MDAGNPKLMVMATESDQMSKIEIAVIPIGAKISGGSALKYISTFVKSIPAKLAGSPDQLLVFCVFQITGPALTVVQ